MTALIFLLIVVGLLAAVAVWAFNSLRSADQGVQKDWHNITTELQRRAELIPNLVKTVQRYAAHEQDVLASVTAARVQASDATGDASDAAKAAAAQEHLGKEVHRLLAVAEAYPQLRASENFAQLQADLTDTEDRIAASRKLYNSSVEHLNNKTRTIPTMFFVSVAGVTTAEYYMVSDEALAEFQKPTNVDDLFS